jgi:hypothetical protein
MRGGAPRASPVRRGGEPRGSPAAFEAAGRRSCYAQPSIARAPLLEGASAGHADLATGWRLPPHFTGRNDVKLGWPDLIIANEAPLPRLLQQWSWRLEGKIAPVFLNKFGSWFFVRPAGAVEYLDVFTGITTAIADSYETFVELVNQREWQEKYLLSRLVFDLHASGKIPGAGQCYAIAPHPALGGPNPSTRDSPSEAQIMIMDLTVWQSICRQALGGPA